VPDVVIENPVINSPFEEPRRHFVFADSPRTESRTRSPRADA